MSKPLVAILGCGPSGLLAAWACEGEGVPFVIFSEPRKSELGGAQFSHIEIPGLTDWDDAVELVYRLQGEGKVYQNKVYGATEVPFVSFDNVYDGQVVHAWNLRGIYETLWDRYVKQIVSYTADSNFAARLEDSRAFDLVFSTVPADAICADPAHHTFTSHPIRIYNQALDESLPNNTILYDGTKDHSWYRMSRIFGVGATEWGGGSPVPPGVKLRTVMKPISTTCNCHPKIIRIGRFGTWTKGQLTMHAYFKVMDTLAVLKEDL